MAQYYRELKVWQKSMELVTQAYTCTGCFPKEETYGLTAQLRRAAISIPSNIAEGASRDSTKDFLRFIAISIGSLAEMETQFIIAKNLNFLTSDALIPLEEKAAEVGKMLRGLQKSLESKLTTNHLPLATAI